MAHRQALLEDEIRTRLREYAEKHRELIEEFITAVAVDDRLASDLARQATTILKRRDTYAARRGS